MPTPFTHQWTVNHLRARLCHPGELKSATFDSPEGAKPATTWRLVLFHDGYYDDDDKSDIKRKKGPSEVYYVSLRLDRLISMPTQASRSQNKDDKKARDDNREFKQSQEVKHPRARHLKSSEIWVEASLKTPTIVYREKRDSVISQIKGPRKVPSSQNYSYPQKMIRDDSTTSYEAVIFNHCLSMSKLRNSLQATFDCEIKVWLLDDPVHVHRAIHVPQFNLSKLMEENRRKNLCTDVTLVAADKEEFRAHKAILAAQSDFFKTRFSSRWQDQKSAESSDKVELTDVPGTVMEVMLSYMYTGEVAAIEKVATSVLPFAEEYGLEGLRKMCEQSLAKSLTSDNVVDLLITANAHNALDLKKVCMDYISSNVVSVKKSEGWRKLKERQDYRDLWVEVLEKVAERS